MMVQGVSITEMLNQSVTVLTSPSVSSFERFEKHGGMREALIYVGIAALISGLASFLFGLLGGFGAALIALLTGFLSPIISFAVFAFLLFFMGKQFGGTGTQDEVFYTTSLYVAPLQAITGTVGAIPILGFCLLPVTLAIAIYQAYLAYLAARASMNLDQNNAIITVVLAVVVQIAVTFAIGLVIGLIAVAIGVGTGAISS